MRRSIFNLLLTGLVASSCVTAAEWEKGAGFRKKGLSVPSGAKVGFTLINPISAGITWTNSVPPDRYTERANLTLGSGLALGDYDNDGLCDIFLCNKFGPSALYRN